MHLWDEVQKMLQLPPNIHEERWLGTGMQAPNMRCQCTQHLCPALTQLCVVLVALLREEGKHTVRFGMDNGTGRADCCKGLFTRCIALTANHIQTSRYTRRRRLVSDWRADMTNRYSSYSRLALRRADSSSWGSCASRGVSYNDEWAKGARASSNVFSTVHSS
jgi:hypothetical protein